MLVFTYALLCCWQTNNKRTCAATKICFLVNLIYPGYIPWYTQGYTQGYWYNQGYWYTQGYTRVCSMRTLSGRLHLSHAYPEWPLAFTACIPWVAACIYRMHTLSGRLHLPHAYPEWPLAFTAWITWVAAQSMWLPRMLKVAGSIPGRGCTGLYYARGAHEALMTATRSSPLGCFRRLLQVADNWPHILW